MIQQIPDFFRKCISRENKLLRTQTNLNTSHFSLTPTGMQAFCLWCLCFFSTFPIAPQGFVPSWAWCAWRPSLPPCGTLFSIWNELVFREWVIPHAQKKFVKSLDALLCFKCLSLLCENNLCRNSTSWRGLPLTEHSNWGVLTGVKSWSGNVTEDQRWEVKERGNHSLSIGLVGSWFSIHFVVVVIF